MSPIDAAIIRRKLQRIAAALDVGQLGVLLASVGVLLQLCPRYI